MALPASLPIELSRRDRKQLAVRAAMREAAASLFDERGLAATKVTEICERADVAQKTFFNHFASKQELVRELARFALEALLADALAPEPEAGA